MAAHGRGKGLTLIFHPLRNCKLQFTTCKANLLKLFPDPQRISEQRELYRARGQKTDTAQTLRAGRKGTRPRKSHGVDGRVSQTQRGIRYPRGLWSRQQSAEFTNAIRIIVYSATFQRCGIFSAWVFLPTALRTESESFARGLFQRPTRMGNPSFRS